jgi:hypothetical protein
MNFVDQNGVTTFIDQNGVVLFVDQNGIFLGTGGVGGTSSSNRSLIMGR